MRLPQSERRERTPPVIIPLINIVFLLLIFFMLFGSFRYPELFTVAPPISEGQEPASEYETVLLISADGRLAIGKKALDRESLRKHVAELLAEHDNARIKIKADAAVGAYYLIGIMDLVRDAGARRVVLLTTPTES